MMEKIQLFAVTDELKTKIEGEAMQLGLSQGAFCRMAVSKMIEEIVTKRVGRNDQTTQ